MDHEVPQIEPDAEQASARAAPTDLVNLAAVMNSMPSFALLKVSEAAALLRITPRTLRRYIGDGTIPAHLVSRTGGRPKGSFRFTAAALQTIAETLWRAPEPPPQIPQQRFDGMVPYRPRRRVQ